MIKNYNLAVLNILCVAYTFRRQ